MSSTSTTPIEKPALTSGVIHSAASSVTRTGYEVDYNEIQPQWLVVQTGEELMGLPLEQVREVLRLEGLHSVPGTPVTQAGIMNVRGAIVTVLDLRAVRTGESAKKPTSIVLLQHGPRTFGIAVEGVHGVRVVSEPVEASHARPNDPAQVVPLDAAALCVRLLHSVEESER